MWSIIQAAGWPIWPIIISSILALAIIAERIWSLRDSQIVPRDLLAEVVQECRQKGPSTELLQRLSQNSPLGRLFATGLKHLRSSRDVMKESIEDEGRSVAHDLERFLTTLGTIAAVSPLFGLLGTVIGMVEIFGAQNPTSHDPTALAHGISVALYNTSFGLIVAIPSLIFYRYFRAKVDSLTLDMERQTVKLIEILHGNRQG